MDADGQHAPSDIPAFLQAYARTGSVALVGNRMDHPAGMPGLRRFVNRFMSALLSRLIRQHVPDTQCGFRLYHRSAFPAEAYDRTSRRFALAGHKIGAVTIQTIYGNEKSKVRPLADTIRFVRLLRRFRKIRKEFEQT